jgi:hypothetical protein
MDISGYTAEQIRQMPELAHLYKAVLFLEQNKGKNLFPKKYEMSVLNAATRDTHTFFSEHPTMPLKEAVVAILGSFKSDISGDLLLKITQKIIETWEKCASKVAQTEGELELETV